jgi:hypothetical protein
MHFGGDHLQPWDNFRGSSPVLLRPRGVHVMVAPGGVVHSQQDCVGGGAGAASHTHLVRIWIDAGGAHHLDHLLPFSQVTPPRFFPQVRPRRVSGEEPYASVLCAWANYDNVFSNFAASLSA